MTEVYEDYKENAVFFYVSNVPFSSLQSHINMKVH